jgi:hypothetical protein
VKAALGAAFEWLKKELTAWATEIPDRMKATITGGTSDPEGMRAQDWAIGGAVLGMANLVVAKVAGWFGIGGGAAAAAGGGAGAAGGAAAGGGAAGTGVAALGGASVAAVVTTVVGIMAVSYGFAKFMESRVDWSNRGIDWEATKRANERRTEVHEAIQQEYGPGTQAAYAASMRYSAAMTPTPSVGGAYGMLGPQPPSGAGLDWSDPFGGKVWDEAAGGFVDAGDTMEGAGQKQSLAAARMASAVSRFGAWVHLMPSGGFPVGGAGFPPPIIGGNYPSAKGYSGMVYSPKTFTVGEGGRPEHVQITPSGKGRGGGLGGLTIQGDLKIVSNASDPKQVAAYVVRELEKAASNG